MFWDEIKKHSDAGSAHQFLLHFNVNDLLYDDVTATCVLRTICGAAQFYWVANLFSDIIRQKAFISQRWVNGETHSEPLRFSHSTTNRCFSFSEFSDMASDASTLREVEGVNLAEQK